MTAKSKKNRVLLIDRHEAWRVRSARALRDAGVTVEELGDYGYPAPPDSALAGESFDLVILGCPNIGEEEKALIERIVGRGDHLLVLSTSLPWLMTRSIFLAGVDDVAYKPYDPFRFVEVVQQTFEAIKPRDSFRAVAREVWP